jgi:hypothetical protein
MKRVAILAGVVIVLLCSCFSYADEGMWLYNAFPKQKVKAKYGFEPTQQWLDHLRLASVRFNNGGSGSFVSADGLTFTNHHVGAECIQQLSTGGKDYIKTGFYAATEAEEAKCPSLELNQLVGIEDVTSQVNAGVKPGMSASDAAAAQRSATANIEKDCASSTGLRCDVITLYSGEVFDLYKYKKYTDVRLVFAPEFAAAFFGGDPDNFEYPRYDLDITFFRVYENNKPAHISNYLHWSPNGIKDGELIFVSGNPGRTDRLKTMSQLDFLRDMDFPQRLEIYQKTLDALRNFAAESQENARIAEEDIFGYANSQKAINGEEQGLKDPQLMQKKAKEEDQLKAAVKGNPKLQAEIGDPWAEIAQAMQVYRDNYLPIAYVERMRGFSSELAHVARNLVRGAEQRTKPNDQRLREYRDSALPSLEQEMFSPAPIYKSLEVVMLTNSFNMMEQKLGPDNAVVKKVLNGKTPAEAAKQLIDGTKLEDVAVRKQLWEGGERAIQASTDPLIVAMREIEPDALAVRKIYDDQVDAVERRDGAKIARARFSKSGFTEPPDAGFTLRLSYGAVKGYTENGKRIPYFTTMGGAYQHADAHGNKPPYELPESWMKAKSKLKLSTPLDFVSTADIIGGNSGSPTVNKAGEVVGIIFDGNIESLPWDFEYDDRQARAISVDSRGIIEALHTIYGANGLADELTGSARKVKDGKNAKTLEMAPEK